MWCVCVPSMLYFYHYIFMGLESVNKHYDMVIKCNIKKCINYEKKHTYLSMKCTLSCPSLPYMSNNDRSINNRIYIYIYI